MNQEMYTRFSAAMDFLNDHPAVNRETTGNFFYHWAFFASDVCKNGIPRCDMKPEDVTVSVKWGKPGFEKYCEKYPDDVREVKDRDGIVIHSSVYVPYADIYGEPWKFGGTEYGADYSIYKFSGKLHSRSTRDQQYDAYEGGFLYRATFEDVVIALADTIKCKFGDFRADDFLTDVEKANHDQYNCFTFIPCPDEAGCKMMLKNPDHMDVPFSVLNLRWWDWFKKTDVYARDYKLCCEGK